MALVTLQILDGPDRGQIHTNLPTPVTVGREDGNTVQLNDERVSRFHIKIQEDQGQVLLTDLESTNGTRVNGETVEVCLLRPGDQIRIGGTLLVFGSREEIAERLRQIPSSAAPTPDPRDVEETKEQPLSMQQAASDPVSFEYVADAEGIPAAPTPPYDPRSEPPQLPAALSPIQAAQVAELLRHMHRQLARVIEAIEVSSQQEEVRASLAVWQTLLALEMDLARLLREIAKPE